MSQKIANKIINELKKLEVSTAFNLNQLRSMVALERILARVSFDEILAKHLIFKGGFVMAKVYGSSRYTRDIDALGSDIALNEIKDLVPIAILTDLADGLWFGDLQIADLEHSGEYHGLRFDVAFQIGVPKIGKVHKLSRVHFDIGIGDALPKAIIPQDVDLLVPLGESVSWRVYPPEYIYSEKLETLVKRAATNSRAKDLYDLRILFDKIDFAKLIQAIAATFARRGTNIPPSLADFISQLDLTFIQGAWDKEYGPIKLMMEQLTQDFAEIDSAR